ncbi:MAG: YesL family protein [Lachnospiraceae bacterium]|nr:YesL family protein [Lachnospiraceae bacterium]
MKNVFDQDGAVVKYGNMVVNLFFVSILWLITSVPLITIGASLPAMYDTVYLAVRKEKGYVAKTYFSTFYKYFKSTFKIWLLQICVLGVLGIDLWYFRRAMIAGRTEGMFFIPMLLVSVFAVGWVLLHAYFQTDEDMSKMKVKEELVLCAGKMHWTFGIALLFLGAGVLIYIVPVLLLIGPGALFLGFDAALERMLI